MSKWTMGGDDEEDEFIGVEEIGKKPRQSYYNANKQNLDPRTMAGAELLHEMDLIETEYFCDLTTDNQMEKLGKWRTAFNKLKAAFRSAIADGEK